MRDEYRKIDHEEGIRGIRAVELWLRSMGLEYSHSYVTMEDAKTGQRYVMEGFIEDQIWEELSRTIGMRGAYSGGPTP